MKRRIKVSSIIGVSLALTLLVLAGKANAGFTGGCTVTAVFYDHLGSGAGNRLKVTCFGGGDYYTNQIAACHASGIDETKVWYSLAASALVSGKVVDISFENGGSCTANTIYSLTIR